MEKGRYKLNGIHHQAIELKYEGMTYKDIAEHLSTKYKRTVKERTIRYWFSAGGTCEAPYMDYMKKENERRRRIVQHELQKVVQIIPTKLHSLLQRKDEKNQEKLDRVTVSTIKIVLDTLGFKVDPDERGGDPIDHFFDRVEQRIQDGQGNPDTE